MFRRDFRSQGPATTLTWRTGLLAKPQEMIGTTTGEMHPFPEQGLWAESWQIRGRVKRVKTSLTDTFKQTSQPWEYFTMQANFNAEQEIEKKLWITHRGLWILTKNCLPASPDLKLLWEKKIKQIKSAKAYESNGKEQIAQTLGRHARNSFFFNTMFLFLFFLPVLLRYN